MKEQLITSVQNERVKHLVLLREKSSVRRAEGVFVVEGVRELRHCASAGHTVLEVYYLPGVFPVSSFAGVPGLSDALLIEVSAAVYRKIACREGTEGVVAVVRPRRTELEQLVLPPQPLLLVTERVEKPGNIGAMLRSADAAGVDAMLVCEPATDIYNPNIVRSSLGAVFTVPCVECTTGQCIDFLKARGIAILTAQLQDAYPYYHTDMRRGTAIVMGTEATGLSTQWRDAADAHIQIPMRGKLDSLNVSASAAILLFEAVRQRTGGGNGQT